MNVDDLGAGARAARLQLGFSGHGMRYAPAAARGIAELMVHGRYRTLDLTRLGYERVEAGTP